MTSFGFLLTIVRGVLPWLPDTLHGITLRQNLFVFTAMSLSRCDEADAAMTIHIARTYLGRKRNDVGQHFWARGYFSSTVGLDEQMIREYIRHQEAEDRRIDQLPLM